MRELYGLARQFQQRKVWDRFSDADLVVVPDSVAGEPGYCCIMGMNGEFFALHCYIGARGWAAYVRLRQRQMGGAAQM
jgi:hypothetical protein